MLNCKYYLKLWSLYGFLKKKKKNRLPYLIKLTTKFHLLTLSRREYSCSESFATIRIAFFITILCNDTSTFLAFKICMYKIW